MIFVVNFCMRHVVTGDFSVVATSPTDDQKNLDTLGGPVKDAPPTPGNTGSDDVRCTTIDDVSAARRSLCPAGCSCSPISGQDVLTKLTVDCSGSRFNQSTSSRLTEDLIRLLSQCVSELLELTIANTPITAVPEVVCRLTKIRALNLNSNRLASLPSNCFTHMLNLTSFSATSNRLTSLQVR